MNFLKKHRIWSRFIGITLSIAILIACVPLFSNNTTVAAEEVVLPNLVTGGDFESGTTLPTGFETVTGYEEKFNGYYTVQSTDKPTGFTGNNLKMVWDKNDFATFTFFTVRVPVESGATYTLNYKIYTPDTSGSVAYRFSYGTEKWNGANWGGYGSGRKDTNVKATNGTVSQTITATSNELWLLFGVKDGRTTVDGDAVVYFDDISVTPVAEYVADGSFEAGNLDKWNKNDPNTNFSVVKASDENITACDNEYVLKITGASGWPYVGREGSNTIAVTSGSTYQFSFYVYRVSSNSEAVFKLGNSSSDTAYNYNGSQQYLNSGGVGSSATGTWIKVTRTFTATDSVVKLYFNSNGAAKDTVYIDNVSIKKLLNISATAQEGGSVSGLPTGDIYSGDKIDLTATPDEAYEFDGWYEGDKKVSSDAAYSFIAYKNVALTAKFKAKNFELIKNGSFEDGTTEWSIHNSADFTSVKASDEGVTAIEGTNVLKGYCASGTDWSFINQTVTVKANTKYCFTISYNILDGGRFFYKGGTSSAENKFFQQDTITTSTNGWKTVTKTFTTGASDTTFKLAVQLRKSNTAATFVDNISLREVVNITTVAEGGVISGVPTTVAKGDKLTVTAVPNAGFAFDGWYKNGVRVADTASYTFYAAADTAIEAKFVSTNNLIADGGFEGATLHTNWANGSARGSVVTTEKYDGAQSLFIEKQGGYANLYYWPLTVEKNSKYRITMMVKVPTGANIPMIKVLDNGGNGNVILDQKDGSGNTWLNARNNNIKAGCDWQEAWFTFNSGDKTQVSMLFTGDSNAAAYIDDVQIIKYYDIKATAESGGKISGFTQNWAYVDTPISLTATPESGFTFDGWYEGGVKFSSDATLQFNATADRNLTAKFAALDNYIVDGGFEQSALVSAWSHSSGSDPRLTISTAEHYEGDQSALFASKTGWANSYYTINVKKNTNYMVTVMIKVPEGDYTDPLFKVLSPSDLNTNLIDGADPSNGNFFCRDKNSAIKAGGGWQKGTFTFNSGNNDTLRLLMTGNTKANCYIDNLVVGEAFTATITAGEHGKAQSTTVMGLKNTTSALVAIPDADYMVEGWYINGQKVSDEKTYNHLFTEDVAVEVKFTVSDLPVMTRFDLAKLWCAESNNLLSDSGFQKGTGEWNTASFIKNGVLDVVEDEGDKVLYFNPDGTGRQIVYFPVSLEGNTEYLFSAEVKGKYYSATNHMDMNFGIMTDEGEFITMRDANMGGYRDERPNITFTKSITPPSWDNNWHRRGITFKTVAPTTVWIAIAGNLSEAYLDDFILCKFTSATEEPVVENIAKTTSYTVAADKMGCDEGDNLVKNYNFNAGSTGWEDGYGWNGLYSGVYIGDSGNKNNSLFMRSTTGYADRHYYIQWVDVKPNTDYTFSLATAATSLEANFGLLAEGAKRYEKLAIWTVEGNREWTYNAITFNSNDSTRVGIYVMDGGRVTALDEIRLFETSKATALTNKLEGKADLPEEYIPPVEDEDVGEGDGEQTVTGTQDNADDQEEETPTKKTKKKKVVKVLKNNNDDADYTLWWILGGVGAAILLAGAIVLIIFLLKKRKRAV